MEVSSTTYDGTGMVLARILGTQCARTRGRLMALSSADQMEKHHVVGVLFNLTSSISLSPPNWYHSIHATGRDSSLPYPTLPSKTPISSIPMRALLTFIRSVLKVLEAVKQGRRRELRPLETSPQIRHLHLAVCPLGRYHIRGIHRPFSVLRNPRQRKHQHCFSDRRVIVTPRRARLTVTLCVVLHHGHVPRLPQLAHQGIRQPRRSPRSSPLRGYLSSIHPVVLGRDGGCTSRRGRRMDGATRTSWLPLRYKRHGCRCEDSDTRRGTTRTHNLFFHTVLQHHY
jgi:hypothetical protein